VTARTPVRKTRIGGPRRGSEPDAKYLKWIRKQPCVVCSAWDIKPVRYVLIRIEAAHVGLRGMSQMAPDRQTIPLCLTHHTLGPHSHHRIGKLFWEHWGLNRFELIAEFNARYEKEKGNHGI